MREKRAKYLRWLLLLLFIGYYGSVSLFMHVHVENGVTIVHSHPFQHQGQGHHHDSLAEIQLFHQLSQVQVEVGVMDVVSLSFFALPLLYMLGMPAVQPMPLAPARGPLFLRAPPCLG